MKVTEQEFLKIIDENDPQIKHLCRTYVNRSDERKDLYQEIIIEVWNSLSSFKADSKMSTWIYRIAVNTAISFIRKKKTLKKYHTEYKKEQKIKVDKRDNLNDSQQRVDQLYEAISTLNPSEKAIISMYLEDFSYAEISYAMDITENYVGVKLNRIKNKLSDILGDEYGT